MTNEEAKKCTREILNGTFNEKKVFKEGELYPDITQIAKSELYPEEKVRLFLGYGKSGYFEKGQYVFL